MAPNLTRVHGQEPKLVVNKTPAAVPQRAPPQPPPKPQAHDLLDFAFSDADAGPMPPTAAPPARPSHPPPPPPGGPPTSGPRPGAGNDLSGLLGALDIGEPAPGSVQGGFGGGNATAGGGSNPFADDDDAAFGAFTSDAAGGEGSSWVSFKEVSVLRGAALEGAVCVRACVRASHACAGGV